MHNVHQKLTRDLQIPSRELLIHCLGDVTMRISYWNEGITWQISNSKGMGERLSLFDTEPSLSVLPSHDEALQSWLAAIPDEIRIKAHKYSGYFAILYLTSHYKQAYQLFSSQPTLFWLLLTLAKEAYWSEEKLLATMLLPRAEIALLCGLPAGRSVRKLLAKLDFIQFDVLAVSMIKKLTSLDANHKLNHCKTLHHRLVLLLLDYPELIGSRLIYQLSQSEWCEGIDTTFKDTLRLGQHLGINAIMANVSSLQSAEQLQQLHDELVERTNSKETEQQDELEEIIYPEPPVLGNDNVIAIRNQIELIQEGIEQENCVASYHDDIVAGEYYIYKVIYPERATLGLNLAKQPLELEQLFLADNQHVSENTGCLVKAWLEENNKEK